MSITHTRPTLMSPSLPLGGIKKFLQDKPSPKTKGIKYMKPITKCYVRIMNKAKNICVICFYICYATVPALPYLTLHYITLHYITLHYITLHYISIVRSLINQSIIVKVRIEILIA
jgi:hypothetical protein